MLEVKTSEIEIEGIKFTGYFDYDQRRDKKIYRLTDDGKIKWFKYRAEKLFYKPLIEIFTNGTPAHAALNSDSNAFMMSSFSVLLNGIEALGSFITDYPEGDRKKNKKRFKAFIDEYMIGWNKKLDKSVGRTNTILEALWHLFRNGLAHSFIVENGCLDSRIGKNNKCKVENGEVIIHLELFVDDFKIAWNRFFEDIKGKYKDKFFKRFKKVYPLSL